MGQYVHDGHQMDVDRRCEDLLSVIVNDGNGAEGAKIVEVRREHPPSETLETESMPTA